MATNIWTHTNAFILFGLFMNVSGFLFSDFLDIDIDTSGVGAAAGAVAGAFAQANPSTVLAPADCVSSLPLANTTYAQDGDRTIHTSILQTPNVVTRIGLDLSKCPEQYADHHDIIKYLVKSIHYIEASDPLQAKTWLSKNYDDDTYDWISDQQMSSLFLDIDGTYTSTVILGTTHSISCIQVQLYGCASTTMCGHVHCFHGDCVSKEFCSCHKGYFGELCDKPVSDLPVDNFTATYSDDQHIGTIDGSFMISGDSVGFIPDRVRRDHSHGHSGSMYFHGHDDGHCRLENTHCHHNSNHRCSGSSYSVFNNKDGYSHSNVVQFADKHDHHHEVHFYNTHYNGQWDQSGSSLHYCDHMLHMHSNHDNHRCHLSVPWTPRPNTAHTIGSTYSPHYGCSIYVDGHHHGSASTSHHHSHAGSHHSSLCIGSCGSNHHGSANCLISALAGVGTSASQLALNGLLGLLGHLTFPHTTQTTKPPATKPPPTTTTPAMKTITTTTAPTKKPSTPMIFTATRYHQSTTANSTSTDILCYSCKHLPVDGACTNVIKCGAGQVCSIFKDAHGYTHECLDKQVCQSAKTMTNDCWKCCNSMLCNDQCSQAAQCQDTANCALLKSTGYDVCHTSQGFAASECKKTCGLCSSG